jgi:hypothetical protein
MSTDVIDEVRRLAPPVSTTSELGRARQRSKLSDAIATDASAHHPSQSVVPGMVGHAPRTERPSRRRMLVASAVLAIAAVGAAVALPLSLHSTKATPSPAIKGAMSVMKVDSYRLSLPSDYRLTATTTSTCTSPGVGFASPNPAGAIARAYRADVPANASLTEIAANADGGCIAMVLAPLYTPTATNPDPEAGAAEFDLPVKVGQYQGRAVAWYSYANPSGVRTEEQSLYVEIPVAGGEMRDLVVSAIGLSQSQLISVVANGLTVGTNSSPSPAA